MFENNFNNQGESKMNIEQLEKLNDLKEKGIITNEEFEAQKKLLLEQDSSSAEMSTAGDKSLWEYFVSCITEKYFCFKGRARRKEYWSFVLFNFLITFVLGFISGFLGASGGDTAGIDILSGLVSLAFIIPGYAVLFRRLHDVNFSGWWATGPIIAALLFFGLAAAAGNGSGNSEAEQILTILGALAFLPYLVVIVLIFFKSDMHENKYGPVPEGVK